MLLTFIVSTVALLFCERLSLAAVIFIAALPACLVGCVQLLIEQL